MQNRKNRYFVLVSKVMVNGDGWEQKTKTKKSRNFAFLVFAPKKNEKRASVFCFWTVFGGAKTKKAKLLAIFVLVFCSQPKKTKKNVGKKKIDF